MRSAAIGKEAVLASPDAKFLSHAGRGLPLLEQGLGVEHLAQMIGKGPDDSVLGVAVLFEHVAQATDGLHGLAGDHGLDNLEDTKDTVVPGQSLDVPERDRFLLTGEKAQLIHFVAQLGQVFAGQFHQQLGGGLVERLVVRRAGVVHQVPGQLMAFGRNKFDEPADLGQLLSQFGRLGPTADR